MAGRTDHFSSLFTIHYSLFAIRFFSYSPFAICPRRPCSATARVANWGRGARTGPKNGWKRTMLARSFLSASDLGISEVEREALITTLFAFERGEIVNFTMRHFRETCGT